MFEDEIVKVVERITRDFDTKAVIIFGPAVEGKMASDNYLGVAAVIGTDLPAKQRGLAVRRSLGNTGVPVELLVFTPEEIEAQRMNPWGVVGGILSSGKVVYGSI